MFVRQVLTLVYKNLLVAAARRPISTIIRAFVLPLLIVLLLSYAQYFLNPAQTFGIGPASPVHSLSSAISKATSGRDTVVFVDNGLIGGDIAAVIEEVSDPFRNAGKHIVTLRNEQEISNVCQSSQKGASNCFAAVVFESSITQPKKAGIWNYTLRADTSLGSTIDVNSPNNDGQVYLLPFQKAIDVAIVRHSPRGLPDALTNIEQYPFTVKTEQFRRESTRMSYLEAGTSYFGIIFFLAMVGVIYQLTGLMASEREKGLSQLLEAMMPNHFRWAPQAARILAYHGGLSIIYFPSWLATGIVLATVVLVRTNAAITIFYHLTVGLALTSYAILGAAFFKKSQVSGIVMALIAVVLAIIPQVLSPIENTNTTVLALSFIFPSSNYVYFLNTILYWEAAQMPAKLSQSPPKTEDVQPPWTVSGATLWCFLILQIILYPILGALIERLLFSTESSSRKLDLKTSGSGPTLRLNSFSKIYKQNILSRIFWKSKVDVHAVKNLSLGAQKGEILMLLGPNGSGKSTTLDAVAGLNRISGGTIQVDGTGGIGIAPQKNVLWDELTVEEHVRILFSLKARTSQHAKTDLVALVKSCDLSSKAKAKSKTLSGGQKRKLQLAMMFAGGSAVCCVDEVSSGLDPLSRRKIWDILLAERSDRTIIMTTHFLDEADFLADHIVILSKGVLTAEGSSAGLKQRLGNGYSIHVPAGYTNLPNLNGIQRKHGLQGTTYSAPDAVAAGKVIDVLEQSGVDGHRISGPTLEDLFLKLTGTHIQSGNTTEDTGVIELNEYPDKTRSGGGGGPSVNLHNGRHIGAWRQLLTLLHKRWTILGSNYMPYIGALIVALIGAGVTPLFLKHATATTCNPPLDSRYYSTSTYTESLGNTYSLSLIAGPPSKLVTSKLASIASLYPAPRADYYDPVFTNATTLMDLLHNASSLGNFEYQVMQDSATTLPGAIWLGDGSSSPRFAWQFTPSDIAYPVMVQNLMSNFLGNVPIATAYTNFDVPPSPQLYEFAPLLFSIYVCLVLGCYPAFFAIYPTIERLRRVRALHYSNGVRTLPLWLAYIIFDTVFILVISVIAIGLFSSIGTFWYHLPYMFIVLFLFGISSTLLAYILSLLSRSALAAWAFSSAVQAVFCLAYFGAYLGIQSNVATGELSNTLDKVQYTIGLISPVVNLLRACFVTLNQFALLCGDRSNPGSMELFGGPILYLVLQILGFFGILIWCESGFSIFGLFRGKKRNASAGKGDYIPLPDDVLNEVTRVKQSQSSGLRVSHLSRTFKKNKAVNDITFGVEQGEVFALLGPNGAGKSTAISLIRGDINPTGHNGEILVDEISMATNRNMARSRLGVCPQFDACDALTVKQHLLFYARVRGVADPVHNTEELIRAFGLGAYRDRLAQKLSGGTKRKLSLAIALIGNPSVLLLDEPSSGLDAASKRVMWNNLSQLSPGRAMVLTTHSMEEADALADRAGIMASRMLTLGTVEDLRHRWGDVYHVHLVTSSAPYTNLGEMGRLKSWVKANIAGAEVEDKTYCGQMRFTVPAKARGGGGGVQDRQGRTMTTTMKQGGGGGGGGGLGQLFSLLNENRRALGVEYYSIGQTTMDEVFVKIVRQHGGREENS